MRDITIFDLMLQTAPRYCKNIARICINKDRCKCYKCEQHSIACSCPYKAERAPMQILIDEEDE